MGRRRRNSELSSRRSDGKPSDLFDGLLGQVKAWSPQCSALAFGPRQSCLDSLTDTLALELSQGAQDV